MKGLIPPTVIVGQVEAGRAAEVRQQINKLIYSITANTFDLAELLYEAKTKEFYKGWGFDTFAEYAESLSIKPAKSHYLVRIVDVMNKVGIPREQYEPVGVTKLRMITRLNPEEVHDGVLNKTIIEKLVHGAKDTTSELINDAVNKITGNVGGEAFVWMNFSLKADARDYVVKPALEAAKQQIGSVGKTDEGISKDVSDGAALEMICADFLSGQGG